MTVEHTLSLSQFPPRNNRGDCSRANHCNGEKERRCAKRPKCPKCVKRPKWPKFQHSISPKRCLALNREALVLESAGKFQFSKTDRRPFVLPLKKPLTHFNLRSAHRFNWVEVELKQEDLLQITRILWTFSRSTELVGMVAINYLAVQTCFALIP